MTHPHQETLSIDDNGTRLDFHIALPLKKTSLTPVILIFPAWAGRDNFCIDKAVTMANKGYIGVAVDVYGEGRLGKSSEECQNLMMPFVNDRQYLQQRLARIIDTFTKDYGIVIAIGYCFGGLCVLDAVRSNLGLKGAISVHGLLNKPAYELPQQYASKVLALHGYQDPMVTPEHTLAFQEEMLMASVDLQMINFSLGVHAFTNPEANDPGFGTVYSPLLDCRASGYINLFLQEIAPL